MLDNGAQKENRKAAEKGKEESQETPQMIHVGTYKISEHDWQKWIDNRIMIQVLDKPCVDTLSSARVFGILKETSKIHDVATALAHKDLEAAGYDERRGDTIDIWLTDVPGIIHVNLDKGDVEILDRKPGF